MQVVEVDKLSKSFGDVVAVHDLSFTMVQGEVFGLLGPNGAGKTTTINMLTGLVRPDRGRFTVLGLDGRTEITQIKGKIGVVPDESNLYDELTGYENLCFCAALYGVERQERGRRAGKLLEQFGLAGAADRRFKGYSKGMKRKLTIAAGIIHDPEVLFLDEPTTGIDVPSARQVRQLVRDLNSKETTILLTTHYIEEAERLCDRVAFMVGGQLVRIGKKEDLLVEGEDRVVVRFFVRGNGVVEERQLKQLGAEVVAVSKEEIRLAISDEQDIAPLVGCLSDGGFVVLEARIQRQTLEDVFVRITGIEPEAMAMDKARRKR